ncbi:MAG TPA: PilZ domain-containing protein [Terriglobales bacterium]|nr:PilZ domain-containing protein [Terriglobales bacterium]
MMQPMENGTKERVEEVVVRIWGMNALGKAFSQSAYARNLLLDGALLSGVDHALTPSDTIGVQYKDKKARCRVVSTRDAGLPQKIQVEVRLVQGQECPWAQHVSAAPAKRSLPNVPNSKRRFERLRIPFPMEVRDDRGGTAMQTSPSDVSGRGCYIESLVPLPLGTNLVVTFWLDMDKIVTPASVRTSDPGVGMGIEFTGLSPQNQDRLQVTLEKLKEAARDIK